MIDAILAVTVLILTFGVLFGYAMILRQREQHLAIGRTLQRMIDVINTIPGAPRMIADLDLPAAEPAVAPPETESVVLASTRRWGELEESER